jgi:hypothetical protein
LDLKINGDLTMEALAIHAEHYSPGAWAWILAAVATRDSASHQPCSLSAELLLRILPELDLVVGGFLRRIRDQNTSVSRLFEESHPLLSEPKSIRVRPTETLTQALTRADQYSLETIQRLKVYCRHPDDCKRAFELGVRMGSGKMPEPQRPEWLNEVFDYTP